MQVLAPLTGTLSVRFDKRDLSRRREPRYRGSWRLPGPELHRLADDSLSLGYAISFSFSSGIRAAGYTTTAMSFTSQIPAITRAMPEPIPRHQRS